MYWPRCCRTCPRPPAWRPSRHRGRVLPPKCQSCRDCCQRWHLPRTWPRRSASAAFGSTLLGLARWGPRQRSRASAPCRHTAPPGPPTWRLQRTHATPLPYSVASAPISLARALSLFWSTDGWGGTTPMETSVLRRASSSSASPCRPLARSPRATSGLGEHVFGLNYVIGKRAQAAAQAPAARRLPREHGARGHRAPHRAADHVRRHRERVPARAPRRASVPRLGVPWARSGRS